MEDNQSKPDSRIHSALTTGYTASAPDVRPMSADIPIMDMYRYSKLPNTDYGIEGYETPAQHFDHALKKKNDELWKLNSQGKRKKGPPIDMKAKRGGLTDVVEARAKATPGPWTYDIKTEWVHGQKNKVLEEVPSKEVQGLQFKWQGVPKDKREFRSRPKTARPKLDLSVRKYSYIDLIILENSNPKIGLAAYQIYSKKDYPLPGPGAHFHDAKTVKKLPEAQRALVTIPASQKRLPSKMG